MKKRSKKGLAVLGISTIALLLGLNYLDAKIFDKLNPFSEKSAAQNAAKAPKNVSELSGSHKPLSQQVDEAVGRAEPAPAIRREFLDALIKDLDSSEAQSEPQNEPGAEPPAQTLTTQELEARINKRMRDAQEAAERANRSGAIVEQEIARLDLMDTPDGLHRLASAGDREAQFLLAGQYLNGSDGTAKDINLAHDLFFKAYKQEQDSAVNGLMITILDKGLDPEKLTAFNGWMEAGIASEDPAALFLGGQMAKFMDLTQAQEYAVRRKYSGKAAQNNFAPAMYDMGLIFSEGLGGDVDMVMAKIWLRRAANAGSEDAAVKLTALGLTDN